MSSSTWLPLSSSTSASITSNNLAAQARAFWNSVITPDISLNGLAYVLAYDKKLVSPPTVMLPPIAIMAPNTPIAA